MDRVTEDLRAWLALDARTRPLLDNAKLMGRLDALVTALSPEGEVVEIRGDLGPIQWPKVAAQGRALKRDSKTSSASCTRSRWERILKWADGQAPARGLVSLVWNPKIRAVGGFGPWLEALGELRSIAHGCTLNEGEWKRDRGPLRSLAGSLLPRDRRGARRGRREACQEPKRRVRARPHGCPHGRGGRDPEDVFPLVSKALDAVAAKKLR